MCIFDFWNLKFLKFSIITLNLLKLFGCFSSQIWIDLIWKKKFNLVKKFSSSTLNVGSVELIIFTNSPQLSLYNIFSMVPLLATTSDYLYHTLVTNLGQPTAKTNFKL